jgi:hypothetical protein
MIEEYKQYEKSIKKKHIFAWTPKYQEETRTNISPKAFTSIVEKIFNDLEWDIVYKDEKIIEAKRKGNPLSSWGYTEKITVTYDYGKVIVKSQSLGNELWDSGKNSKRVRLFIHVLKEKEKSYKREDIQEIEKQVDRENNWEDYEIPKTLPKPKKFKQPNRIYTILGAISASIILGFLLAFLTKQFQYIIILYEILVGVGIGFILKTGMKTGNYFTNRIPIIIGGTVFLTYFLNQFFLYLLVITENNFGSFSFFDFIQLRFEQGLIFDEMNTGWIGLIISWIIQIVISYYIAYLNVMMGIATYQIEKIPREVIDFAYYHLIKGKEEIEVRNELSKMGWKNENNQDEVFAAIFAIYDMNEVNRMT